MKIAIIGGGISGLMVAQFNSPYALPMFRKNELMVRILNAPNKELRF